MWNRTFRSRKWIVISLALMSVILVSYIALVYRPESIQSSAYATSDEKAYSVDPTLVSANTKFAFDLFRELGTEDVNKNIFISPLSISTALAMTFNGAEGTTKDGIANTLNFDDMTLEKINQEYSNLIESLKNVDQAVSLLIGNSVWIKQEFKPIVKSSFLQRVGTSYDGETFTRDFGNQQTVNEINGWVDQKTEGKINQIIKRLTPDAVMLLINAIYFKGEWMTKFDETKTCQQDFFLPDGNTVNVDMMSTQGNFSYYEAENCQVARLPYGRDKIAMYVFLPDAGISLDSLIANLNETAQDNYVSKLQPVANLIVELPKFNVEYGTKCLNDALTKLGMGIAFDPDEANFSGIAPTTLENLYISYVDHKAIVEVNEEGTEAAAVTKVVIGMGSSLHSDSPPRFVVDRPFFFEIRDDRSGSILFMGKIYNPTDS